MTRWLFLGLALLVAAPAEAQDRPRARELGIRVGVFQPGVLNAITDDNPCAGEVVQGEV